MNFDVLVNELLEQNRLDEDWKRKVAMVGAGLSLLGGSLKGAEPAQDAARAERARRIQAAEMLAQGKSVSELPSKYAENDQSPQAKAYRERMKRIKAAEELSKNR